MLYDLFGQAYAKELAFVCLLLAFLATCLLLKLLKNVLPRDGGRALAINGMLSQGKPRGAGIVFIIVFSVLVVLSIPVNIELVIYLIMLLAAMISGYLDDSSKTPWGELKKGVIDLIISLTCAVTYVNFNGCIYHSYFTGIDIELPKIVFILLATLLVWASINVTNCSDGVDGLSGSLSIISMITFYIILSRYMEDVFTSQAILIMIACLLGYLWFNASPSKLLMGDAGSRAIGMFIAVIALKTKSPVLYIPAAIILILDGGLGLVKLTVMRVFKVKRFMRNIRTPLHDHARKNKSWSDTQTVFRFVILQATVSFLLIYLLP